MSGRRFGSWPSYGGKKVVLDDDPRLVKPAEPAVGGGVPTRVPADTTLTVPADYQMAAHVRIQVDGTLKIDGTLVML